MSGYATSTIEYCVSASTAENATPAGGSGMCASALSTMTGWLLVHKSYAFICTFSRIGSFVFVAVVARRAACDPAGFGAIFALACASR